jgi:hypothetical protein
VGTPALRRAVWVGVALLAAGIITALAFHGRRPDSSLARFEAAGVMVSIPPDTVTEVVVTRGDRRWRFERAGPKAWTTAPGTAAGESVGSHIDSGLRLLHASAPQRVLEPGELTGASRSELGLEPPRFSVSIRSSAAGPFRIDFGALNAQGLAQYAQLPGRAEVLLLPGFVGDQWEAVMKAR